MAFELKTMTQQALDDESSDADPEDDEDLTAEQRAKRQETGEWIRFCKEKITKIEKIWNRKLEESSTGEDDSDDQSGQADNKSQEEEDDNLSQEETIAIILEQNVGGRFGGNNLSRSNVERIRANPVTQDLMAAKESLSAGAKTKDDNDALMSRDVFELGAKVDFANNNFWRNDAEVSDTDLEEMMRGEGME